jgi:hypothetical protein
MVFRLVLRLKNYRKVQPGDPCEPRKGLPPLVGTVRLSRNELWLSNAKSGVSFPGQSIQEWTIMACFPIAGIGGFRPLQMLFLLGSLLTVGEKVMEGAPCNPEDNRPMILGFVRMTNELHLEGMALFPERRRTILTN